LQYINQELQIDRAKTWQSIRFPTWVVKLNLGEKHLSVSCTAI